MRVSLEEEGGRKLTTQNPYICHIKGLPLNWLKKLGISTSFSHPMTFSNHSWHLANLSLLLYSSSLC